MNRTPDDPYKELPVNQSAVQGVSAGRDVTIGSINQIYNATPQLTSEERRDREFRKKLLTRVKKDWFSILDERLSSESVIELSLKTRRDLIRNLSNDKRSRIKNPDLETDIETLFSQWEGEQRILILGDPGAGKTIALLQLGKKICSQAEANILEKPIPVVFHLSSWIYGLTLSEWLIQQLESKYGFPVDLGETWVRNRNLCPLLDGLDEIDVDYQANCIQEINKFGASDIVVCSRLQQYEALYPNMALAVDQVVCVQPLKPIQINSYLESLDKPDLQRVLNEDPQLSELAKVPFWLMVITDIDTDLPREGSSEERKNRLFEQYIEKTFKKAHESGNLKFDRENVLNWLAWLASKSESFFLIEEMQPSWLTKNQQGVHLAINLASAALIGLMLGPPYGFIVNLYLNNILERQIPPVAGIILGIFVGITIGPFLHYFLKIHKLPIKTHNEVNLSFKKVQEHFWISLRKSSYEAAAIGLIVGLFCSLLIPPLQDSILKLLPDYKLLDYFGIGIVCSIFFGLVTLIIRLLSNSLIAKKEIKTLKPNQGIFNSFKEALLIGKITSLLLAIILASIILIIHKEDPGKLPLNVFLGICSAIITGPYAAIVHHSGRSCLQHITLRATLYLTGSAPWNYAKFLDHANELTFLNKIGGGYQFFHKMFQDYLAFQKLNQS